MKTVQLVCLLGVMEVELLGAHKAHDDVEDAELASSERANHDATRGKPLRAQLDDARLRSNVAQAREHAAGSASASLVDLGEQRVRRVRDDRRHHAGDHTGAKRDGDVATLAHLIRRGADGSVDSLGGSALDGKLGHRVGDLLEEDGDESRVEGAHEPVLGHHLLGARGHAVSVGRVGDEANAARLVRAEEAVGDELGHGGGGEVDLRLAVPRRLVTNRLGDVDLEELDATELEPSLDKVALAGGHQPGEQSAGALGLHHLREAADEAAVVLGRVELDARLDHVHRGERTVREAAADAAGERTREVVGEVERALAHHLAILSRRGGEWNRLGGRSRSRGLVRNVLLREGAEAREVAQGGWREHDHPA